MQVEGGEASQVGGGTLDHEATSLSLALSMCMGMVSKRPRPPYADVGHCVRSRGGGALLRATVPASKLRIHIPCSPPPPHLQMSGTVYDLEEAELCYAPQYGSAKDAVNFAGMVAANVLRGDMPVRGWRA